MCLHRFVLHVKKNKTCCAPLCVVKMQLVAVTFCISPPRERAQLLRSLPDVTNAVGVCHVFYLDRGTSDSCVIVYQGHVLNILVYYHI
jgi:hypothetical protein